MEITPRKVNPGDMSVEHREAANPTFNPGRRAEIKYRDLGLEAATRGDMRAEVMQFLHMIKGWVKMEFGDAGVVTLSPGDSITIPGGTVHQELCSSDDMELLEISVPAKLGTVNVEAPEWARERSDD